MDISVTRFRASCLELIRRVETGGEVVDIKRRGKVVGDPADRLIVSTSWAQKIPLATHDAAIRRSRVTTVWKPGA